MNEQKNTKKPKAEDQRPISPAFGIIDNDLARDNLEDEMDMTAADRQDV